MSDSSDSDLPEDGAASPPRTPPPLPVQKFIAFKAVSISDVKSKFQEKAVVTASEFSCAIDPKPVSFVLNFTFGTEELPDVLLVEVSSVNRWVTAESVNLTLFNDETEQIAKWDRSFHDYSPYGYGIHERSRSPDRPMLFKKKLKKIKDKKMKTWHLSFTLVYTEECNSFTRAVALARGRPTQRSRLENDLEELFETGRDTDVTFLVQEETFKAHKTLLSFRSPYFKSMFDSKMTEAQTSEINVTDVSPEVFKEMLHFIYSEYLPEYSEETTLELFSTADKYGIDDLKSLCQRCLLEHLGPQNVIEVLLVADRVDCKELAEAAAATFRQYIHILRETPKWKELVAHPNLLLRLLGSFCN